MVTVPVASYLGWAGLKCEITDDLCSGLLTDTERVRASLEGVRALAGAGGAALGTDTGVTRSLGALVGRTLDLLMVTWPTASYL